MSAANATEHIKFLVSCIQHATNGKVDFEAVRLELDIVSKAAAAKRYERLLKNYANATTSEETGENAAATPKKRKAAASAKAEPKKIKKGAQKGVKIEDPDLRADSDANDAADDTKEESDDNKADM